MSKHVMSHRKRYLRPIESIFTCCLKAENSSRAACNVFVIIVLVIVEF